MQSAHREHFVLQEKVENHVRPIWAGNPVILHLLKDHDPLCHDLGVLQHLHDEPQPLK